MTLPGREKFDFRNLFIFEMANNHQGSVEHGQCVINEMADAAAMAGVRAAIKLQFRELDSFIHPAYKSSTTNKHIPRFLSTRLSEEQFSELVAETRRRNLITMCTPFDEASVDQINRLGIEVIKIGSCSAQDWPLLEKVAATGKPVICSTGGLTIKDIDKIVSFFQKRAVHFALMHCVAIYPMPNDQAHLNQIELLRNRYPGVTIGFSTHEAPDNYLTVALAYAKGARIFEKHVGLPTDTITLNAYSANPGQVRQWLKAWRQAVEACGPEDERVILDQERRDLLSLMRGVYVKKEIWRGAVIKPTDIFFAIPLQEGQLTSGRFCEGLVADRNYLPNEPLSDSLRSMVQTKKEIIYHSIHAVRGLLNSARIPVGHDFQVELSHHYGVERFQSIGCTIIECINREYAKKIIVQLPGQWNPEHYHKRKDETFHVLQGTVAVVIDGREKLLEPGDTLWVPRGVLHGFGTKTGAIIEEISTTSFNEDSFYADKTIVALARDERKTRLLNWGKHQLEEISDNELLGAV